MARADAVNLLDAALIAMREDGVTTFRRIDLKPVRDRTGHTRTWVTGELKHHLEAGGRPV